MFDTKSARKLKPLAARVANAGVAVEDEDLFSQDVIHELYSDGLEECPDDLLEEHEEEFDLLDPTAWYGLNEESDLDCFDDDLLGFYENDTEEQEEGETDRAWRYENDLLYEEDGGPTCSSYPTVLQEPWSDDLLGMV